jgi:hypothetical protein
VVARNYNTVSKAVSVTATTGGASANVLYTCPANYDAEIDFLHVTNGGAANDNIYIQWYHQDEAIYHTIVNAKSVAGNDVYDVIQGGNVFYMHSGDKIVIYNGGGSMVVSLSGKEFFNPTRA